MRIVEDNTIAIRLVERVRRRADESYAATSGGEQKGTQGVHERKNGGETRALVRLHVSLRGLGVYCMRALANGV